MLQDFISATPLVITKKSIKRLSTEYEYKKKQIDEYLDTLRDLAKAKMAYAPEVYKHIHIPTPNYETPNHWDKLHDDLDAVSKESSEERMVFKESLCQVSILKDDPLFTTAEEYKEWIESRREHQRLTRKLVMQAKDGDSGGDDDLQMISVTKSSQSWSSGDFDHSTSKTSKYFSSSTNDESAARRASLGLRSSAGYTSATHNTSGSKSTPLSSGKMSKSPLNTTATKSSNKSGQVVVLDDDAQEDVFESSLTPKRKPPTPMTKEDLADGRELEQFAKSKHRVQVRSAKEKEKEKDKVPEKGVVTLKKRRLIILEEDEDDEVDGKNDMPKSLQNSGSEDELSLAKATKNMGGNPPKPNFKESEDPIVKSLLYPDEPRPPLETIYDESNVNIKTSTNESASSKSHKMIDSLRPKILSMSKKLETFMSQTKPSTTTSSTTRTITTTNQFSGGVQHERTLALNKRPMTYRNDTAKPSIQPSVNCRCQNLSCRWEGLNSPGRPCDYCHIGELMETCPSTQNGQREECNGRDSGGLVEEEVVKCECSGCGNKFNAVVGERCDICIGGKLVEARKEGDQHVKGDYMQKEEEDVIDLTELSNEPDRSGAKVPSTSTNSFSAASASTKRKKDTNEIEAISTTTTTTKKQSDMVEATDDDFEQGSSTYSNLQAYFERHNKAKEMRRNSSIEILVHNSQ
jgi:hypothetical protein